MRELPLAMNSWHHIAKTAERCGAKFPALVAAQWALESNWGYAISDNNPFGLKSFHNKSGFKAFDSIEDSVRYLVDHWYKDYKSGHDTYRGINNSKNRTEAAWRLLKEGYATDPNYARKLIDILDRNAVPEDLTPKMQKSIDLNDAVEWDGRLPHQTDAWTWLQSKVGDSVLREFARRYRGTGGREKAIQCPYFYQRDSKTGHGERSCQSSAIAMAIKNIEPDLIVDDDDYLNLVLRYGDTVSQAAHMKALDSLRVEHDFRMDGNVDDIREILDIGCPVPIGILHRGPLNDPTGGGHYVTVIGEKGNDFIVHDPFGKLDLDNGVYVATGPKDGKNVLYDKNKLVKRWSINGSNDGWLWDLADNVS